MRIKQLIVSILESSNHLLNGKSGEFNALVDVGQRVSAEIIHIDALELLAREDEWSGDDEFPISKIVTHKDCGFWVYPDPRGGLSCCKCGPIEKKDINQ
jgi:hypothetical protein